MDEQSVSPALPPGVSLRPASPADLPRMAAFLTEAHPESPVAAEDLETLDARRLPGEPHVRTLAVREGRLVGLAETGLPRMDSHEGWLDVTVRTRPDLTGGALAGALLAHAEANALAHGAQTLLARVREDWWERRFHETRGYREHDRMWTSTLDLRTLDFARFAGVEERVQAAGVRIAPLSELVDDLDEPTQRRLYALMAALLRDVPSATPIDVWPFELWRGRVPPRLRPEGFFVAVAPDDEWVGVSELHLPIPTRPGTLHNGLTGVLPGWRGQGIALALKLAAARAGLARGYTHSRTSNHSINGPMLAVNERLGFVREAALVTLTKEVRG